jgi:archaellum component FlaC
VFRITFVAVNNFKMQLNITIVTCANHVARHSEVQRVLKAEIEYQIQDLKSDYVRLQNDLERLESLNGNVSPIEKQLQDIEFQLSTLNKRLADLK